MRKTKQDAGFNKIPDSQEHMYRKVMDPNSDWPEPALKGEHLQRVLKR